MANSDRTCSVLTSSGSPRTGFPVTSSPQTGFPLTHLHEEFQQLVLGDGSAEVVIQLGHVGAQLLPVRPQPPGDGLQAQLQVDESRLETQANHERLVAFDLISFPFLFPFFGGQGTFEASEEIRFPFGGSSTF